MYSWTGDLASWRCWLLCWVLLADRAAVYAYLSQLLTALPHTDAAVLSGDWNAALEATDRRGARSTAPCSSAWSADSCL